MLHFELWRTLGPHWTTFRSIFVCWGCQDNRYRKTCLSLILLYLIYSSFSFWNSNLLISISCLTEMIVSLEIDSIVEIYYSVTARFCLFASQVLQMSFLAWFYHLTWTWTSICGSGKISIPSLWCMQPSTFALAAQSCTIFPNVALVWPFVDTVGLDSFW